MQAKIETLRSFLQDQLRTKGRPGSQAAKKLEERVGTVARKIRLPLPRDRSCNKFPLRDRWIVAPESYLTDEDPRYANEEECLGMKAMLLAEATEFGGITGMDPEVQSIVEDVLEREYRPGSAQCIQTGEMLTLDDLVIAVTTSTYQVGSAELSVEYRIPLNEGGQHEAANIGWTKPAREIILLRKMLRSRVPNALLNKVQLKAYSTDRVTMPPHFSNRDYRWATWVDSLQFASRADCRKVELQLLCQMLEFVGAPRLEGDDRREVEHHLQRPLLIDGCRCPITGDPIVYAEFVEAARQPKAGRSAYHVGHLNPLTRGGKHDWGNVVWMSDAGNRIQGNETFDEIVALIKRAADYHINQRPVESGPPAEPSAPAPAPRSDPGSPSSPVS